MTSSPPPAAADSSTLSPSSPPKQPSPPSSAERESWRERFYASLPLFIVGGVCIVAAVYLYTIGAETTFGVNGTVHLRPWLLFVALGITGTSAGIIALFAEDALAAPEVAATARGARRSRSRAKVKTPQLTAEPRENYPGPTVEELATLSDRVSEAESSQSGGLPVPSHPVSLRPASAASAWDEEALAGPVAHPHSAREAWDESPEAFEAAASAPAPPDVILQQLDELESSLRKKTPALRPD